MKKYTEILNRVRNFGVSPQSLSNMFYMDFTVKDVYETDNGHLCYLTAKQALLTLPSIFKDLITENSTFYTKSVLVEDNLKGGIIFKGVVLLDEKGNQIGKFIVGSDNIITASAGDQTAKYEELINYYGVYDLKVKEKANEST